MKKSKEKIFLCCIVMLFVVIEFILTKNNPEVKDIVVNVLGSMLCYSLIALIIHNVYRIVKVLLTNKRKDDINITSKFIIVLGCLFKLSAIFIILIVMSPLDYYLSFLYSINFIVKWVVLFCIIITIIGISYNCIYEFIPGKSKEVVILREEYNNHKKVVYMIITTYLLLYSNDGLNYNHKFMFICIILTISLTIFELIMIKEIRFSDPESKKGTSFLCKIIFLLMINSFYMVATIGYTNNNSYKKEVKKIYVDVKSEDYSVVSSNKGGRTYSLTIRDSETGREYYFNVSKSEYYNRRNNKDNVPVIIYKGIWGVEFAERG